MQTGKCQCGEIVYEIRGEAIALYVCHCLECQKQSTSAFGISLDVPKSDFSIIQGIPKYWNRLTDSGNNLRCAFCSTCGSRLWHESASTPETVSIKGGSLDKPLDLTHATHVWVKRKLPGVMIPREARQFLEED